MTRLLLVEDDPAISGPLVRALTREGYEVSLAEAGRPALVAMEQGVDIVILDLGLPDMDGLDVARTARSHGWDFPILILTARSEEVDMVVGLDAGADDYVTKPFRLAELLARVRAQLRRHEGGDGDQLRARGITVDVGARRVFTASGEVQLTAKEFELLVVLMRNAGSVVSREELMQSVWGGADSEDSTKKLDMHISWLRRKLGDDVTNPTYIRTVRGMGFRFEKD